jgi:hypothetical protein
MVPLWHLTHLVGFHMVDYGINCFPIRVLTDAKDGFDE